MKAREILLNHLTKDATETMKRFYKVVDNSTYINAMEEYAQQEINKNKIIEKIFIYLILAGIFYLIASFINVDFNPLHWGVFTKIVYSIGALNSLRIFEGGY